MKIMDGPLALGCALLLTATVSAATNPPAPPGQQRFLFLVDTSAAMKKIDPSTRQALFDLIYSGINGQMTNGDTFGIWTFNEQVYTGQFPMQTWNSERVLPLASNAAKFLQLQKYASNSAPQVALGRTLAVIRNVKDVNILMITDGSTPLVKTAFDHQVNPVYEQRNRERQKAKKPFIVTFIARAGQVTNAFVTIAGEPIVVPPPSPPQPRIVLQAKTAPDKTNLTRSVVRSTRRTNSVPLVIKGRDPAPATSIVLSAPGRSNDVPPALEVERESALKHPADFIGSNEALAEPARTNVVSTNAVPTASVPSKAAPSPVQSIPTNAPTNTVATAPVTTPPTPAATPFALLPPTPVAAREITPAATPAAPPRSGISPLTLITAGGLLLGGGMLLLVFGMRRVRTISAGSSLISQSMERRGQTSPLRQG